MDVRPEKTLVVETGILCNNRCVFCYENGYRRIPGYAMLVPSDEIRRRIEWGADNGFNSLSLTGGEPTIRKDFVEIVSFARRAGYEHVAVTTNGSRLGDGAFFSGCVRAGLDGMGVSIHAMSSAAHDALTGRAGSFAAAIKAVRNGVRAVEALGGRRFRLNTFTVIHSGNVANLRELTNMLGAIGVRLMVLQPAITGKSNVSPVAEVPLDAVITAVIEAARAGVDNGYLVKPFNIPPCMLSGASGGLDLTMYSRSSFRENDDDVPGGRSRGDDVGFVRLSACPACRHRGLCSGLSLSLAPVDDLAAAMVSVVREAVRTGGHEGRDVWVTGTELLDAAGIRSVTSVCGSSRPWICTGGTHRIGGKLAPAVAKAGGGLALVHQSRDPGSADRILCGADNSGHVVEAFRAVLDSGVRIPLAVCGAPESSFLELLRKLDSIGLSVFDPVVMLSMPWRSLDGGDGYVREIVAFCRGAFGPAARVVLGVDGVPEEEEGSLVGLMGRIGDIEGVAWDLGMNVPATPFDNQLWSILNWSFLRNFRGRVSEVPELTLDSVRVEPFT